MAGHPITAALYDRVLAGSERAGLARMRAELLAAARGRTLEVGAGTGLNLEHYPPAVTELVLSEPDPHMARRLRSRLAAGGAAPTRREVVEAGAGDLPFADASFATVVATLVLCTVPDPATALAEVRRVLAPGGQLLFIEHVRDEPGTRRAAWQDRLERPWGWLAGGCHPNRETARLLDAAFASVEAERDEFPGVGTALVKPLIRGRAVP